MLAAEQIYQGGVLVPDVHERLVADIENVAHDALIQPEWIWTKLDAAVHGEATVDYVRRFRFHKHEGVHGAIIGAKCDDPEGRMAAMAGALVRNFIRARVCTLNQVVESADKGGLMDITCLLIPNFFVGTTKVGKDAQAAWRVNALHDVLVARSNLGLQTVVYVADMNEMTVEYGVAMKRHFVNHFTKID